MRARPNASHSTIEVLDTARWAEAHGWHGVWFADHYMVNTGTETLRTMISFSSGDRKTVFLEEMPGK